MTTQLEKDIYYLKIAKTVSLRSKCLSRKIGAVLVMDDSLIGAGFNGPPRKVKHCNERPVDFYAQLNKTYFPQLDREITKWQKSILCPRRLFGYKSGEGLHLCCSSHAERNALIQAARNGIATLNTTLYCVCPLPCKNCCIELINAGIKKVVCLSGKDYDSYSRILLTEANIKIVQYEKGRINDKKS